MKDELGVYYTPSLQDESVRMYVRRSGQTIEFRMHNPEHSQVWDKHKWVPYEAIQKAAEMFKKQGNSDRNPLALYDMNVAERLLSDEGL